MFKKEDASSNVVKLLTIVALDAFNSCAKLGGHIFDEMRKSEENLGF